MAQKVKDLALSLLWLWLPQELPYAAGTAKKKEKKNFQGIVCGLKGSLPHGSLHLHLRSWWSKACTWGELKSSVARRKAKSFQRVNILLLACHCSEMSNFRIFFIPAICLQVQKSFFPPVLFLLNQTQVSLIQSHHVAQPQCTCSQLCSKLGAFLEISLTDKNFKNSCLYSVTAGQSMH